MVVWEIPAVASQALLSVRLLFHFVLQPLEESFPYHFLPLKQVDEDATVSLEAFSRIAPAIPIIADVIICENLFEMLTSSMGGRLRFSVYDKYLYGLER